ncbi:MAG: DUF4236 domain-containing protein [Sphingomonadales bacterium]|nr:DUF4236 domain-containing protein [Sphingomonadales bacterium]
MPFYIRKSVKAGPFRFNFSKGGLGLSVGVKGLRVGTGPRGHYIHAGRGGLYYRASLGRSGTTRRQPQEHSSAIQPLDLVFHDDGVDMRTIESGNVLSMQDEGFSTVLDEIRAKQKQPKMSVVFGWLFGIVGVIAAANIGGNASILLLLALPAWAAGRWVDSFRRSAVLFYDLDGDAEAAFKAVTDAFDALAASQGKWHIEASGAVQSLTTWKRNAGASHLVRRKSASLGYRLPGVVKSNVTPPAVRIGRKTIYFLPDVALIEDGSAIGSVAYHELKVEWANSRFIEDGTVPRDAEVIDHTWQHPNKKGGPDRRYKNNRRLPVCLYETLHLHSASGVNELLEFSRRGLSTHLATAFKIMPKRTA